MEKILNLDEFLPEDVKIIIAGEELAVTSKIPRAMFMKFVSTLQTIGTDNMTIDANDKVNDLVIEMLSIKNKRDKVVKIFESIDIASWNRIVLFITRYINESVNDDKKKID